MRLGFSECSLQLGREEASRGALGCLTSGSAAEWRPGRDLKDRGEMAGAGRQAALFPASEPRLFNHSHTRGSRELRVPGRSGSEGGAALGADGVAGTVTEIRFPGHERRPSR